MYFNIYTKIPREIYGIRNVVEHCMAEATEVSD